MAGPACRTWAQVGRRFGYRPYGRRGNPLPHLSQATSSPAGGGTGGVGDGVQPMAGPACRTWARVCGRSGDRSLRGTGKPSPSPVASDILPRWGRNRRRRGRRPRRPVCRTRAQVGGRGKPLPYGGTSVCFVGAGLVPARWSDMGAGRRAIRESPLRGNLCLLRRGGACPRPFVGHASMSAERSGDRSLRGTGKPSPSPVASDILPRWGRNRRRRGRRPRRPAGRTRAHVGGRFVNRPYGDGETGG